MMSSRSPIKKVYINGRFLSMSVSGVQRYARELIKELDALLVQSGDVSEYKVEILTPQSAMEIPAYQSIQVNKVGRLSGHAWEQLELPYFCRGELLFTPCGGAPVLHARNIVTIHDAAVAAVPEGYSFAYRSWYRLLHRFLSRHSKHILTISNFSKSEIIRYFGADANKITVVYLGSEHAKAVPADRSVLQRHGLEAGRFIFTVGFANKNKNVLGLASAAGYLQDLAVPFVRAGGKDSAVFGESESAPNNLKSLGYVSEGELRALYENAGCFVFPSLYEGFGLPPLEAIALGCPTVVAKCASLPEIFEGMALFADPRNSKDIAMQIRNVLKGKRPPSEDAAQKAASYSWKKCALETWTVLKRYV